MLTPELIVAAYREGYFPMGEPTTGEIHWFKPPSRAIIPLDRFHAPRSLVRTVRKGLFKVTFNESFNQVIRGCAHREETWITDKIIKAYRSLHRLGFAHSVEVWKGEKLVGGLYGVSLGGAFFAESMFHYARDASKVALVYLVDKLKENGFELLEVQYLTTHLKKFGAIEISDAQYKARLRRSLSLKKFFRAAP